MTEEPVEISNAELDLQLPRPAGYRILVALPQPRETVVGTSILKTEAAMFRMNSGTRFTIGGIEYRLMNDDSVEAVVADPSGIQRA